MKNIYVYKDPAEMSVAAAEWITGYISKQLSVNQKFTLLLSGGNTPKELYDLLAADPYRNYIEWNKMHLFFGDERVVSFEDARNNGRMAFDHLVNLVPVPAEQVHFIKTNISERDAAKQYETLLKHYFNDDAATFDLSLMGMGDDGHTLSLFPGSTALHEKEQWVITSMAPVEPAHRITLTAPVVIKSRSIMFLVSGQSKARALEQVLQGDYNPDLYPSQLFRDMQNVQWFADREAMSLVNSSKS